MQTKNENETGSDLFARLLSQKLTSTNASTSAAAATSQAQNTQQPVDPVLTQLENILMINKSIPFDDCLLPNGISNRQIVEITGREGKTELAMHLIARYLLPPVWKFKSNDVEVSLDLREFSAAVESKCKLVLIETESKFSYIRLFTIMEHRIHKALLKLGSKSDLKSDTLGLQMKKFIRECMKNMIVYQCHSNEHFILSLAACENYIQSLLVSDAAYKTHVMPIFIDSLSSHMEIVDKFNFCLGVADNDYTEKYALQLIKKLLSKYNVCFVAVRPNFSLSLNGTVSDGAYLFKKWQSIVNVRLELTSGPKLAPPTGQDADEVDVKIKQPQPDRVVNILNLTKENSTADQQKPELVHSRTFNFKIDNSGFNVLNQLA